MTEAESNLVAAVLNGLTLDRLADYSDLIEAVRRERVSPEALAFVRDYLARQAAVRASWPEAAKSFTAGELDLALKLVNEEGRKEEG